MNKFRPIKIFLIISLVFCTGYIPAMVKAVDLKNDAGSARSETKFLGEKRTFSPASATRTVCKSGCDYTSINDAIQNSNYGDLIDLSSEVYTETVIIDRSVTIQGDGADNTIVQARGDDETVTSRVFDIEPWMDVVIDGVTIRNGNNVPRGAGIRNRGFLTLSNSVVISNTATDCGGGIYNWARDVDQRADLIIENSTITNNYEMDSEEGFGGGIYNYAKDGVVLAYLNDSLVAYNEAVTGGGISNHAVNGYAMFSISSSTIRENTGLMSSGGIDNRTEMPTATAELIIDRSTIDGNVAENNGGGLYNESIYGMATVDLTKTTISYNEAAYGAGVANIALNETAEMTVTNSTISNNMGEVAAGLWNKVDYGETNLEITASTINANVADLYYGGIWNQGSGVITMQGSIAANNIGIISTDGADCMNSSGTFNNNGYNIIETSDGSCGTAGDGDPGVGELRDNGGPTLTHALLVGSPAINAIPPEFCIVSTDQRGIQRPVGPGCDIGSYEYQPIVYLPCLFK